MIVHIGLNFKQTCLLGHEFLIFLWVNLFNGVHGVFLDVFVPVLLEDFSGHGDSLVLNGVDEVAVVSSLTPHLIMVVFTRNRPIVLDFYFLVSIQLSKLGLFGLVLHIERSKLS